MKATLLESAEGLRKVYDSLLTDPKDLGVLSNKLAVDILRSIAREPMCAMDIARSMEEDQQKVYYYLRKLERAGIVILDSTEMRHGMMAKLYKPAAPVVSAKVFDGGYRIPDWKVENPGMLQFLSPFVEKGKLNAKIILADPYPHGNYDRGAKSTVHAFDIAVALGKAINAQNFPTYQLDTETSERDLRQNLILFSSPRVNVILDRMNRKLPVFFDPDDGWAIKSGMTGKKYDSDRAGVIMKWDNPFNTKKKVMVLAGITLRGMRAVSVALTRHLDQVLVGEKPDGNLLRVVDGLDRKGNRIIDSVDFLE